MVAEKTRRYQGLHRDLPALGRAIVQGMEGDGYKVQSKADSTGIAIQAQKAGILRDLISADRAFTILITGEPDDFSVKVGIGKLVQNLAATAVEVVLISGLFLAVDVPEMLWTTHVENEVIRKIDELVKSGSAAILPPEPSSQESAMVGGK